MTIQNIYVTNKTANHLHKTKFIVDTRRNKNVLIIGDIKTPFLVMQIKWAKTKQQYKRTKNQKGKLLDI